MPAGPGIAGEAGMPSHLRTPYPGRTYHSRRSRTARPLIGRCRIPRPLIGRCPIRWLPNPDPEVGGPMSFQSC